MASKLHDALEYLENNLYSIGLDELNFYIDETLSGHAINENITNSIIQGLPELNTPILKTLELANVSGNLTQKLINKYKGSCHKIIATILVNTEDKKVICQKLMDSLFGSYSNVKVIVLCGEFLDLDLSTFNIIVGIPEIKKVTGETKKALAYTYNDSEMNNISGFSLYKALSLAKNYISLTIPKYFLHNYEFSNARNFLNQHDIDLIIDFGELAFKTMGIEFINIGIVPNQQRPETKVFSMPLKKQFNQLQENITSPQFPSWVIYINDTFMDLANKMQFDLFEVFRDRQITNALLLKEGKIPVLKSKNIPRNAREVCPSDEDVFINPDVLEKLSAAKFLDRDDVYLCPNMSPYPRLVLKPKGYLASGSLAVMIPKIDANLSPEDIAFFASSEFEQFYKTARNFGTRSLNLDKVAVFYFGKLKNKAL